jgi:hypothetical protein
LKNLSSADHQNGIVDDDRAFERHAFQGRSIKGNFVRDAVDYHIIFRRIVKLNASSVMYSATDVASPALINAFD